MEWRFEVVEENARCLLCGEEVPGLGTMDVPYHVECVLMLWQQRAESVSRPYPFTSLGSLPLVEMSPVTANAASH